VKRSENEHSGAFKLLFLSRIDPKKNVDGLIRALRVLRAKEINVTLSIAGDGEPKYVATLQSLTRDLALTDCVNWLGHLDGEQKYHAMSTASAFVLPSHSENFGIAVVEALAAGLPCLVSREVGIADEVEQAGAGVLSGTTPVEIAAGIEQLLTNRRVTNVMSTAARTLAHNKFSIDTMGARLEALYRTLVVEETRRAALAS
jgi:glycosyltransferase involved in cell wall biosynthesis